MEKASRKGRVQFRSFSSPIYCFFSSSSSSSSSGGGGGGGDKTAILSTTHSPTSGNTNVKIQNIQHGK